MVYGEYMQWLQTAQIVDKSGDIDDILNNIKFHAYIFQKQFLFRLAQELENNVDIIGQIEVLSRGVLLKDTKKAVGILAEYLYYYSSFAVRGEHSGAATVGVFEDNHPLWILGLFLAPALASGFTIILQTGTKFAAVVTYILELAKKVGIPQDVLVLIPSNEGNLQIYLNCSKVSVLALFVDLLDEKYKGINKYHKKILVLSSYKTPMLVFENADLDSAVESVIDAAWGYQGMLPWSVNTLIVQENVFHKFTEKLKNRLNTIRIGSGDDCSADIAYPNDLTLIQNLHKTVEKAKSLGIEVFQNENKTSNNFLPTLIIGSKVDTNNVLSSSLSDSAVTIVAFRSIDEAVSLANNNRQGLGASVWSENIGLVNEVARKLMVGNVWINSHGLLSPDHPLVPLKHSGVGCFGGCGGLYEWTYLKALDISTSSAISLPSDLKDVVDVRNAISSAKSASAAWSNSSQVNKIKVFQQLYDFVESNKNTFAKNIPTPWIDKFISAIQIPMFSLPSTSTSNGYSVTSMKYPKGVLVIEMRQPVNEQNAALILGAIWEGNAVVLLNEPVETEQFYQDISKKLPSGLLSVFPYSLDAVKTASLHKELNGYFSGTENPVFGTISLADSKIFGIVGDSWENVLTSTTVVKNIWSSIGQSSQCNL